MIKESLRGVTRHSDKKDILTPWKEMARYKREVYMREGVADPSIRRGMFNRAINTAKPELNSRDGFAPPRSSRTASLREHVEDDAV